MSSFNRKLADLINDQGDLKSSKVDSFDSSEVNTIISSNVTGTATYYGSLDSLPNTGLTEGQKALVKISDSVGRLYISDGSGWYNANTNLNTAGPTWVTEPDVSYTISDSVTPLTITALATDVDSDVLVDTSFAADSAQYLVTISRDSSVWTFTPKSADSIGESVAAGNLEDSSGEFTYTFRWNDGVNVVSKEVTISYSTAPPTGVDWGGDRAVAQIGYTTSDYNNNGSDYDAVVNDLNYFDITTPANAQDFGDLSGFAMFRSDPMSNGTRGVFWGGDRDVFNWNGNRRIQYVTTATLGNASYFGQPLYFHTYQDSFNRTISNTNHNSCGTSDAIYGLQIGGTGGGNVGLRNSIEYITIDTQADAQQFGYFGQATASNSAWNDATRSVMYHGTNGDYYSTWIKYLTTQTTGNATAISNSHPHGTGHSSCSDSTWGVTYGGTNSNQSNNLTYNVTQTLADATTWGSLSSTRSNSGGTFAGCTSNGTYGVIVAGGNKGNPYQNIERFTIKTTGSCAGFGDLLYKGTGTTTVSGNAS